LPLDVLRFNPETIVSFFRRIIAMAAPKPPPVIEPITVEVQEPAIVESDEDDGQKEKERMRAIISDAEAVGRERLANFIALETVMTIESAKAVLLASARESTAPCTPANSAVSDKAARQRHMDADFTEAFTRADFAIPECAEAPETVIQRMRRNYHLAAGVKAKS
jgi:hypothetical protein